MSLHKLLGTSFNCDCGRHHEIPVKILSYEENAISHLPEILKNSLQIDPLKTATVVADKRTFEIAGKKTQAVLSDSGIETNHIIVPDRDCNDPVCDTETYQWLQKKIAISTPDIVIATGSGVINDLCKWTSASLTKPYIVIATAASMNGYSSANVSAKVEGVKILLRANSPLAVLTEPKIIENAPYEMTAAGFGDVIVRPQCNTDWIMNNFLFGEYYCDYCSRLIKELEKEYITNPQDIKNAEPTAMKALFEGLFYSGLTMTMVGASAPASGGEHLFSHTLDMMSGIDGEPHDLHGRQVGVGVIFSAALYDRILQIDTPSLKMPPQQIDESFWTNPAVAKAVREQYAEKQAHLKIMCEGLKDIKTWNQLKEKLRPVTKTANNVKTLLQKVGAASSIADINCPRERVKAAIHHSHEIRKRCTVIDLALILGILPAATDEIIDQHLL